MIGRSRAAVVPSALNEPPAGVVVDSNPRRRRIVNEATADIELRRILNVVEPLLQQCAAPRGRAKSILLPRIVVLDELLFEDAVRRPRAKTIESREHFECRSEWCGLLSRDRLQDVVGRTPLVAHGPRSHEVAEALKQTVPNFSLDALDVPITINVVFTEGAWQHMPAHWKNQRTRTVHVMNGMVTGGAKEWWTWAMQETRKSTREILQGVTTLEG